jgi:hypothetical protein
MNHRNYVRGVVLRKKIFDFVISALVSVAFALFLAVILIEWMSGCGEGGECVFIPVNNPETQPQKLDTTSRFVV